MQYYGGRDISLQLHLKNSMNKSTLLLLLRLLLLGRLHPVLRLSTEEGLLDSVKYRQYIYVHTVFEIKFNTSSCESIYRQSLVFYIYYSLLRLQLITKWQLFLRGLHTAKPYRYFNGKLRDCR